MKEKELRLVSRCYGSMSLFMSIAHNVFLLYYVDMFVNIYKIDKASFWIGEVTFLVWNSINDPLFGWLSDKKLLTSSNVMHNQMDIVVSRVKSLQRNGPLFAISFFLFWIHWLPTWLQFALCLCIYDAFLTAVDLQHTALLADLTVKTNERNHLNRSCSIFSVLGTTSVFMSYTLWSQNTILPFQIFCLCITCLSALGFYVASNSLLGALSLVTDLSESQSQPSACTGEEGSVSAIKYMRQLVSYKNFRWFVIMNLIQVFHCHFNSNFFPLFMNALIGDSVPNAVCTLIIGFSFIAPHLNNIYFLHLCEKHGVYQVVSLLFWIKTLLAFYMLSIGRGYVWMTCIFIASNRIFTEGTCKLLNLVVSDMVDEDYVVHHRSRPVSALLFGMSSLLAKPGQTLAPLFGTFMLSAYTGKDIFQNDFANRLHVATGKLSDPDAVFSEMYRQACFTILVSVPLVCGCIQLVAWRQFSLRGARLVWVKRIRINRNLDCAC